MGDPPRRRPFTCLSRRALYEHLNAEWEQELSSLVTGFIGGRLVENLVFEHGARVRTLVRDFARASRIARFDIDMIGGAVTDPRRSIARSPAARWSSTALTISRTRSETSPARTCWPTPAGVTRSNGWST